MTAKLPWFKFFPSRWKGDTELSMCSPATRGVWIDLLCAMHQSGRTGILRGTFDQLARAARCSTAELSQALTDLQTTSAADVTIRNNDVTVVNRLMKQEDKERKDTALRVKKHRSNGECNADETGKKKEVRSKKKDLFKRTGSEDFHHTPDADCAIELMEMELHGAVEFIAHLRKGLLTTARVNDFWQAFRLNLTGEKFYNSRAELVKHFRNWLKTQDLSEKNIPKQESASARGVIETRTNAILDQYDKR